MTERTGLWFDENLLQPSLTPGAKTRSSDRRHERRHDAGDEVAGAAGILAHGTTALSVQSYHSTSMPASPTIDEAV